jgi:hypothetical protein
MPAESVRFVIMREAKREASHRVTRLPSPRARQHFARVQADDAVHGLDERRLGHAADPVDRLGPGGRVVPVEAGRLPQQASTSVDDTAWHGAGELDESVAHE